MKSLSRAVLCINARGAKIGNTDIREKVQYIQIMEKTERTNLGEDGNDRTNVGVWMRAEVQKMKKKGNE